MKVSFNSKISEPAFLRNCFSPRPLKNTSATSYIQYILTLWKVIEEKDEILLPTLISKNKPLTLLYHNSSS